MLTLCNQRVWLVGGSQGIGLSLAKRLLKQGNSLVISARQAEQNPSLKSLQKTYANQLILLNLDVGQKNAIENAVNQAWSYFEGLDIWIYNAGAYQAMTIDEWDVELFEQMNLVNYLGAVYLMNALMPYFRQQGYGQWLWNISLSSDFGLPYGGAYSAPKAALQNLAESIQPELRRENIQLKVVNHGFVKTRLTAKNDFAMLGLMATDTAAIKIAQSLCNSRFETRFPFNLATILGVLKRLPKSWALALTKKALKDYEQPSN
ncbi:MAG: SDR family NAD(P)-dependent oxidoreductase [Thiomicrorhabdus sp.]|nr:SDR family NAD(P)-dependent oxidoreductase [Thiomicrorhabdus sp.]